MSSIVGGILQIETDLLKTAESSPPPAADLTYWGDDPTGWDSVFLARKLLPGISTIDGKGFDNRIDRQKIPGTHGQRLVHIGYDPADFIIRTKLYTQEHVREYLEVVSIVKPPRKKAAPQPVEVVHPALAFWGVTACLVLSGGIPKGNKEESPDCYVVELRCIEFVPTSSKTTVAAAKRDLTDLGPGAVQEKLDRQKREQSPAAQNRGPNASYPDVAASFPTSQASGPGG